MDKLKIYNQILLSIIGTIFLIFVIVGGLMISSYLYKEIFWKSNYKESSIISNEKINAIVKDSLRKQLISFDQIVLIDTFSEIFLIPVNQANLTNKEYIDDSDMLGLTNSFTGDIEQYYYGNAYSNLLIYHKKSNRVDEIFTDRISINRYRKIKIKDEVFVEISVTKDDSNNDGLLNSKDLQQLYIYHVSREKLIEIPTKNRDYINISRLYPTDDFVILYGIDNNKNGEFNSKIEPKIFYKVNLISGETKLLVNKNQLIKLQKRLDGRMK